MQVIENSGISRKADLFALSKAFRVCDLDVVLLGKCRPEASVHQYGHKEVIFCGGEVDFDFRGRFTLPPGWCMVGCIHETEKGSWSHGIPLESHTAFTALPGKLNDFMLSRGSRVTGVLLPFEKVETKLAQLLPCWAKASENVMAPFVLGEGARHQDLNANFEKIRDHLCLIRCGGNASVNPDVDTDALVTQHLLAAISAQPRHNLQCLRGRRTHYRVVQRVEQYLRANLHDDIDNVEMCEAGRVSERTLRNAFHDVMHISPNRYLSMLRLCRAFQSLSSSDASRCSVKSVALSCGFWDFSRFAEHYQQVFRELPHQTLMQASSLNSHAGT